MGVVLVAEHLELGERVAIKILRADADVSSAAAERLRRESRAAARIRGENVARVLDAGVAAGIGPYFVMELVHGKSLAAVLAEGGKLEPAIAIDYVLQACAALAEAHALGIVHRDLKPSNILLTRAADGGALVKVVDFGVAKTEGLSGHSLTETGSLLGSPRYMSPEQAREAKDVDGRTDLWSLGVVLYELLTAHVPFEAFTAAGVISRIMTEPPTPVAEHGVVLAEGLEAVVVRMLARDRDARFATVVDVAGALAPFGGDGAAALALRVKRIREAPREPIAPESTGVAVARDEPTEAATSVTHAEPHDAARSTAKAPTPRWRGWLLPAAIGAAVISLTAFALRARGDDATGPRDTTSPSAAPGTGAPSSGSIREVAREPNSQALREGPASPSPSPFGPQGAGPMTDVAQITSPPATSGAPVVVARAATSGAPVRPLPVPTPRSTASAAPAEDDFGPRK